MKIFKLKKILTVIMIILIMATTAFVFWQATPNAPESNDADGNIIIGQDGTFATSIEMSSINSIDANERLVPKELEGLINAPEGVDFVYEIEFVFDIYWVYDKALDSILGEQLFDGTLLFTTDVRHDLIRVDTTEPFTSITANDDEPVRVVVTISMDIPNTQQEYNDIMNEVISISFTARVIPNDAVDESLFNFTLIDEGDNSVYELSWKRTNTRFIDELIIPTIYNNRPVVIASDAFLDVKEIENVTITGSVKRIGSNAFGNSSLKSLIALGDIDYVEEAAFFGSSVESVTIIGNIEDTGNEAFYNPAMIMKLQVFGSLGNIGQYAFQDVTFLGDVQVDGIISYTHSFMGASIRNLIIRRDGTILLGAYNFREALITNLLIEANKLTFTSNAFSYMRPGANIKIVADITTIGSTCFTNSQYASVIIIGNIGNLGDTYGSPFNNSAIENKNLIIDGDVGVISMSAFRNFNDHTITITGRVGEIEGDAFGSSTSITQNLSLIMESFETSYTGCFNGTNGMTIYLLNQNIEHLVNDYAFDGAVDLTIYVPNILVDEFVNQFGEQITIIAIITRQYN